jgi:hypothetical protein
MDSKVVRVYAMKAHDRVEAHIHSFSAWPVDEREWSAPCPGPLTSGTDWIGGWVNSGAGLGVLEKNISCPCWNSNHIYSAL